MGRIKELQEKASLTEAEQKELNELLEEAKSASEVVVEKSEETDVQKAIEDAASEIADKAVEKAESKISKSIEELTAALKKETGTAEVVKESKFIVDPVYGKKSLEELAEIKVALPERKAKDKQVTEISQKTLNFINALYQGDVEKLQVLTEGTAANGGYLVPEEYANMIVEDLRDAVVMRSIADVMTTTSDTLHLPNLATRPVANFRSEAAVKSTSTVTWGENVFTPYSLATIVTLSNELVADASLGVGSSIVNYVTQVIVRSLAEREDKAFFVGSGSGQPTGMSTYSLGTVAVAAGGTDAQRADAIKQTWARAGQQYRNNAVWVMNAATLERVITLKDTNGNYLTSRIGDSQQMTLMGRPIYEQNDIAGGHAYFGDFSYYKIVDREGINVRVSDEATVGGSSGFEKNLTHVRVEKRVDGELTLTQPIRKVTGLGTP